ncbi:hypothetical protein BJ912DRAFT_1142744 [Pholiota molesta]|nr:hypothetical protein BJ912DRAFT_1142744 [Pholiota molesta]
MRVLKNLDSSRPPDPRFKPIAADASPRSDKEPARLSVIRNLARVFRFSSEIEERALNFSNPLAGAPSPLRTDVASTHIPQYRELNDVAAIKEGSRSQDIELSAANRRISKFEDVVCLARSIPALAIGRHGPYELIQGIRLRQESSKHICTTAKRTQALSATFTTSVTSPNNVGLTDG